MFNCHKLFCLGYEKNKMLTIYVGNMFLPFLCATNEVDFKGLNARGATIDRYIDAS